MNRLLHRLLYRLLPLRAYLLTVSRLYFLTLALGRGRHTRALEYAYHLPRLLRPGDTAIDIGANLGYYTRPMSRIVGPEGRVYAVEPVPVICEVLRRNLRGRDNVRGYFGTGRNFVDDGRNARGDAIRFKAQMRRGSSLFADVDRIDFIKCDIEGYECVVLGEMMPLVRRHHPTILVESGGDNRRSLIVQFGSEGYAPFTLGDDGREHPLDTAADDGRDIIFRYKEPIEQ